VKKYILKSRQGKSRQKKKRKRLFLILLVLIVLPLLVGFYLISIKSVWSRGGVTFVVGSKPPIIVSFEPKERKLLFVRIPSDLLTQAAFGYGQIPVQNLFDLGISKKLGGLLLVKTLEKELGIPIDGWIGEEGLRLLGYEKANEAGLEPELFRKSFLKAIFRPSSETNFSVFDQFKIALLVGTTPLAKREVVDLADIGIALPTKFVDGSQGYKISQSAADLKLARKFYDLEIVDENLTISIVNTTESEGLALKFARIVNQLGMKVALTETGGDKIAKCRLLADRHIWESLSFRRLIGLFGCDKEEKRPEVSDIQLDLGEQEATQFQD